MRLSSVAWVVLVLLTPGAVAYHGQDGSAGLVVDGPIDVDGLVQARASPGAAFWAGASPFDARLTAASIDVQHVVWRETTGPLSLVEPSRTSRDVYHHDAPTVRFYGLGDAFQFLVHQSGVSQIQATSESARFVPQPPGGFAPTLEARADGMDRFEGSDAFLWGLTNPGARMEASAASVIAHGDFTIFLYDAVARVSSPSGGTSHRTGAGDDTNGPAAGATAAPAAAPTDNGARWAAYALIHVKDGRLEVAPTRDFVGLYGGVIDATMNGTARLTSARGSAQVGDTRVMAAGAAALSGVLRTSMSPTHDSQSLRFEADGDVTTFAVPGGAYAYEAASPVVPVSLALLLVGAALWLVKSGGLSALYSRIQGPAVLNHAEREKALELVRATPGLAVADLAEALGVAWSTSSYHLSVLEREGLITSDRRGRHRRYVLVGSGIDKRALAVSAHPTAQSLLASMRAAPGLCQGDLAAQAGVTPSTASWHLKRLADAGLVRVERKWRTAHYHFVGTESMA